MQILSHLLSRAIMRQVSSGAQQLGFHVPLHLPLECAGRLTGKHGWNTAGGVVTMRWEF
jgi:hypothetical protein